MTTADDIEVRKRDLPSATVGGTTLYRGTEYLVVRDCGFGPWAYWILRPVTVQSVESPPSADEGFPTSTPALAAVFNLDDALSEKPAPEPFQPIVLETPDPPAPPEVLPDPPADDNSNVC